MHAFLNQIILDYQTFYQDDWFWAFPVTTLLISLLAFMLFALPWTLLAYIEPKWLATYRIQNKPMDVKGTFWPSIYHSLKNTAITFLLLIVIWPFLKFSNVHTGDLPVWWVIVLQLIFFILLDDFLYYWMHRYMHENKWLLKNIHGVHHEIKNTCAINGNYMHWLEFSLTASIMLIGPVLMGAHLYVLWIWVVIRQFEAADGHMGYDIPWNPARIFLFYHGPVYHDFHHAKFKGNYAGFLSYLDKYFGNTHVKKYLEYKALKAQGKTPEEIRMQK